MIDHCAVTVRFSAGIVAGSAGSHPVKVYPSLVGAAGAVTCAPYATVIGATVLAPSPVTNVIVYSFAVAVNSAVYSAFAVAATGSGVHPLNV